MSKQSTSGRRWRNLLGAAVFGMLATASVAAAGPKPKPPVFKPGHYRLTDGVSRPGKLCLLSDNELLVKDETTAEPQHFAAVQVRNFVIGTDSFTVLRKFNVVLNGVVTPYPCAMVRVYQAGGGVELYGLHGAMDVYTAPNSAGNGAARGAAMGLRNGLAGMAVGAAVGALVEKQSGTYEEKVLTVLLLKTPVQPVFQTLQPKTKSALDLLEAAIADQPELCKDVHRMYTSDCTTEKMVEVVAQYATAKSSK